MERGVILKGVGSYYTVLSDSGREHVCKARGKFRKERTTPMPGDRVLFDEKAQGHALIEEILPRRNELARPMAANIDTLVILVSAGSPRPDWLLVDKLLIQCCLNHIDPLLVLNKTDARQGDAAAVFQSEYAPHFPCFLTSAATGEGIAQLSDALSGRICCFSGQSAVGKSSLLNAMFPGFRLQTGELSERTERGRHTTRHTELRPVAGGGAVLDTPGFSFYEPDCIEREALGGCYPEFRDCAAPCRFPGCCHVSEPDCAVKAAVAEGHMSKGRYERYLAILQQVEDRRKHRYD